MVHLVGLVLLGVAAAADPDACVNSGGNACKAVDHSLLQVTVGRGAQQQQVAQRVARGTVVGGVLEMRGSVKTIGEGGLNGGGAVALCSEAVVEQACGRMTGDPSRLEVHPQELADELATDMASTGAFLTSVGATAGASVSCADLCDRVRLAIPEARRPPACDVGARQVGSSSYAWDIDLSQKALEAVHIPEASPDRPPAPRLNGTQNKLNQADGDEVEDEDEEQLPEPTAVPRARRQESPIEPGKFQVVQWAYVTAELGVDSKIKNKLRKGALVNIVEVQNLEQANRIRGRLSDGGWISIKNTQTGYMWAQPEAQSGPQLLKSDVECYSGDKWMGNKDGPQSCADATKAAGGSFFILGKGSKKNKCYMEKTNGASCPEGFQDDSYDFYSVNADLGGRVMDPNVKKTLKQVTRNRVMGEIRSRHEARSGIQVAEAGSVGQVRAGLQVAKAGSGGQAAQIKFRGTPGSSLLQAADMPDTYSPEPMDTTKMLSEVAEIFRMHPAPDIDQPSESEGDSSPESSQPVNGGKLVGIDPPNKSEGHSGSPSALPFKSIGAPGDQGPRYWDSPSALPYKGTAALGDQGYSGSPSALPYKGIGAPEHQGYSGSPSALPYKGIGAPRDQGPLSKAPLEEEEEEEGAAGDHGGSLDPAGDDQGVGGSAAEAGGERRENGGDGGSRRSRRSSRRRRSRRNSGNGGSRSNRRSSGEAGKAANAAPPSPLPGSAQAKGECGREAIWEDGQEYAGCQATTRYGERCRPWTDAEWEGKDSKDWRKWKGRNKNWCRNPNGEEATIWCFTITDKNGGWESCDPLSTNENNDGESAPENFAVVANKASKVAEAWLSEAISKWGAEGLPQGYKEWLGPSEAGAMYGRTKDGCACKKKWTYMDNNDKQHTINDYCGNPNNEEQEGDWCMLEQTECLTKLAVAQTKEGCKCTGNCANPDEADEGGDWCLVASTCASASDSNGNPWDYCTKAKPPPKTKEGEAWGLCQKPTTRKGCACDMHAEREGTPMKPCTNPDEDSGGPWCFVEDEKCEGDNYGHCEKPCGDACMNVKKMLQETRDAISNIGFEFGGACSATTFAHVSVAESRRDDWVHIPFTEGMLNVREDKGYEGFVARDTTLSSDHLPSKTGERAIMTLCPGWWEMCKGDLEKCEDNPSGYGTTIGTIVHETLHHFPMGADDYLYGRDDIKQWVKKNLLSKKGMSIAKDNADSLEYFVEDINGHTDTER